LEGADRLFSIFDFDGSGKIDINEFLEGASLSSLVLLSNYIVAPIRPRPVPHPIT